MNAIPIPTPAFIHATAARRFDVFAELVFHLLEPATPLARGWHLEAMAAALTDVESGACRRLLVTIPPRSMKSRYASVAFPAWVLGRNPSAKLICVSYSQDLAATHSRAFRQVIQSELYRQIFPRAAGSFIRALEHDLQTQQGGYRLATSLGGTVTGIGADYILIDDLMKAQDASYPEARQRARQFVDETLLSRLNSKADGRIVSIQQRLHEDDIVAHFKEKGGFRELELPAIAVRDEIIPLMNGRQHFRKTGDVLNPQREPMAVLEQLCREMGNRVFQAQWQQNPTPTNGAYIDWYRAQFYDQAPPRERLHKIVHSWDVASSTEPHADYSVGTVWGYDGATWLLLDLIRVRLAYADLLARVRLERKRWRADLIIVEKSSVGPVLLDDLARDFRGIGNSEHHAPYCARLAAQPRTSKQERMMAHVERLYSGFAKLPRQAPWLDDLRRELVAFPGGRHDDQVDSIAQFLEYAVGPRGRSILTGDRRPDSPRRP